MTRPRKSKAVTPVPQPPEEQQQCPVCMQTIAQPYITPCGHTYCKYCITRSVKKYRRCPYCAQDIRTVYSVKRKIKPRNRRKKVECQPKEDTVIQELEAYVALTQPKEWGSMGMAGDLVGDAYGQRVFGVAEGGRDNPEQEGDFFLQGNLGLNFSLEEFTANDLNNYMNQP